MIFIDWLTCSQVHPEAPDWGGEVLVRSDFRTGALLRSTLISEQVQGSNSTSLRVRCQGGRVEVSGNPSKWGRAEAVVGLTSVAECLDVYNGVLAELGLPAFDLGATWRQAGTELVGALSGETVRDGCRISRIDLTRNLLTGSPEALTAFQGWLDGQRWGQRLAFERGKWGMVTAGNRKRRHRKFYDKGREVRDALAKLRRSREIVEDLPRRLDYLGRLADWCESVGLLRDEITLGSEWLPANGLAYAEAWGDSEMTAGVFREQSEISTLEAGAVLDYRTELYARLLASGVSPRQSAACKEMVLAWMAGSDPREGRTRPTFYRLAKLVRDHCGIDVRVAPKVSVLAARIKPIVVEARELELSDLPDFYRQAA
jgi:hypothetical protein